MEAAVARALDKAGAALKVRSRNSRRAACWAFEADVKQGWYMFGCTPHQHMLLGRCQGGVLLRLPVSCVHSEDSAWLC
jgi:hypothetical protein